MSSTVDTDTEIHADYEERARKMIPVCLYDCFNINLYMPSDGYNRKFYLHMFPGSWPLGASRECEIDFFAHSNDVKSIPSGPFSHIDNKYIMGNVSNCTTPDISVSISSSTSMSLERIDPATGTTPTAAAISTSIINPTTQGIKYIVGEVTYGSRTVVIGKLKQLEKDCKICLAKMHSRTNIKDVVSVAILVNPYDHISDVFNELQTNIVDYPNLRILYEAGRFIYIQYTLTHLIMLQELGTQQQNMQEAINDASGNIVTLQNQISTLQNQTSTLQNQTVTLQNQTTTLQNQTVTLQNQTTTLQNQTTTLQNQTTTLQNQTTTLQNQTTQMTSTLETILALLTQNNQQN
jgi:hypothetical protein